jgi:hypothetical protein
MEFQPRCIYVNEAAPESGRIKTILRGIGIYFAPYLRVAFEGMNLFLAT